MGMQRHCLACINRIQKVLLVGRYIRSLHVFVALLTVFGLPPSERYSLRSFALYSCGPVNKSGGPEGLKYAFTTVR